MKSYSAVRTNAQIFLYSLNEGIPLSEYNCSIVRTQILLLEQITHILLCKWNEGILILEHIFYG